VTFPHSVAVLAIGKRDDLTDSAGSAVNIVDALQLELVAKSGSFVSG